MKSTLGETFVFTDGAAKGNPGPGGWGAIIVKGDQVTELGGAENPTTNNRMELRAVIAALEFIQSTDVRIFIDSRYVVNGATKWAATWQRNSWRTAQNKPVLNQDLWERLLTAAAERNIRWELLPGHVGIPGNERADTIASGLASGKEMSLYRGNLNDYQVDVFDFSLDEVARADRKTDRSRSRAKAYSYLSLVDGVAERHADWASCQARVSGKRAKFRKTLSAEDERQILAEWGVSL